jgi:hypothetical protein
MIAVQTFTFIHVFQILLTKLRKNSNKYDADVNEYLTFVFKFLWILLCVRRGL